MSGDSEGRMYGISLYNPCNFSASLKLCQNKKLKNKQKCLFRNSKANTDPFVLAVPCGLRSPGEKPHQPEAAAEGPGQGFRGKEIPGTLTTFVK